ncbi:MAG: nucleoside 2-deoxyribosyltransferase, partial [Candidatus Lokiarchaeota archaeon]|nr:nucleoside 2-deoxyribosyltransferase [Candidatus Lokiarchaeota archaeon]
LKSCGVNAIHPIEPQAMDIRELKEKYGDTFCLIGNVDVDLLSRGSREQVIERVKYLIKEIAPGGGYCLGSGNSVPEYAIPENFAAMVETARKLGEYD